MNKDATEKKEERTKEKEEWPCKTSQQKLKEKHKELSEKQTSNEPAVYHNFTLSKQAGRQTQNHKIYDIRINSLKTNKHPNSKNNNSYKVTIRMILILIVKAIIRMAPKHFKINIESDKL